MRRGIKGNVVRVKNLPPCDFCLSGGIERPARYDFRTKFGPWAYGCLKHFELHRASRLLGIGHGQLLVRRDSDPVWDDLIEVFGAEAD